MCTCIFQKYILSHSFPIFGNVIIACWTRAIQTKSTLTSSISIQQTQQRRHTPHVSQAECREKSHQSSCEEKGGAIISYSGLGLGKLSTYMV